MKYSLSDNPSMATLVLILVALGLRIINDTPFVFPKIWALSLIQLVTYIIYCLLIYINRKDLSNYHVDRLTLAFFVLFRTVFYGNISNALNVFEAIVYTVIAVILISKLKKDLDFNIPSVKFSQIVYCLVGILVGVSLAFLQLWMADVAISITLGQFLNLFAYSMSIPVIAEEPLFRGFLWGSMRNLGFKEIPILVFQAALFSLCHLEKWSSIPRLIDAFVVGLMLGIIVYITRSLAYAMTAHAGFDGIALAEVLAHLKT